jgi:hypothetical protein
VDKNYTFISVPRWLIFVPVIKSTVMDTNKRKRTEAFKNFHPALSIDERMYGPGSCSTVFLIAGLFHEGTKNKVRPAIFPVTYCFSEG